MRKRPLQALGDLEAMVMSVAWARPSVTAREVCARMTGTRERAYTTVMTTLDRLHRKRLLRRYKDGLAWRYEPTLTKPEFERALADDLAAQILTAHGDAALHAFVDAAANVDERLLEKLRLLIEERRKER
ncbi:MAG: BlaI/MecI/CopY family transcriptional regulator [Myxococcales bacterium]